MLKNPFCFSGVLDRHSWLLVAYVSPTLIFLEIIKCLICHESLLIVVSIKLVALLGRLFATKNLLLAQAFYRFRVPEHGVSETFLFVGSVVEPDVSIDRTKLDYGALMLGAALKETFHIVNRESMPHSFVFDKNSLGMAQVKRAKRHRRDLF